MSEFTPADKLIMDRYAASVHAAETHKAAQKSVVTSGDLNRTTQEFIDGEEHRKLTDDITGLTYNAMLLKHIQNSNERLADMGTMCDESSINDDEKLLEGIIQDNKKIIDASPVIFKNNKKIISILSFLNDNDTLACVVFIYNEDPSNKGFSYKPRVLGTLPYNRNGNLNYSDVMVNYDSIYTEQQAQGMYDIDYEELEEDVDLEYERMERRGATPKKKYNLVKDIVMHIHRVLDGNKNVTLADIEKLKSKLNTINNNQSSVLSPNSVKYDILTKKEFIETVTTHTRKTNTFPEEITLTTSSGNTIKLGNKLEDIPYSEFRVDPGYKTVEQWEEEKLSALKDPKSTEWRPASILTKEEQIKATNARDKFRGRGTILVGAIRTTRGDEDDCRDEEGGICWRWLDGSVWGDDPWYTEDWDEPNDAGGESAAQLWDRTQGNMKTMNDIPISSKGNMLMKKSNISNMKIMQSPQYINRTQQINDINLDARSSNNMFIIESRLTDIEDDAQAAMRGSLTNTNNMLVNLKNNLSSICQNSIHVDGKGKPTLTEQAHQVKSSIDQLKKDNADKIKATTIIQGTPSIEDAERLRRMVDEQEDGEDYLVEPFSNSYINSNNSNNSKILLFCLIIYPIIIFLILKIIKKSYLKNIFIVITIILFIAIINLYNSNNIENFSNSNDDLKNNILFNSIDNTALSILQSFSDFTPPSMPSYQQVTFVPHNEDNNFNEDRNNWYMGYLQGSDGTSEDITKDSSVTLELNPSVTYTLRNFMSTNSDLALHVNGSMVGANDDYQEDREYILPVTNGIFTRTDFTLAMQEPAPSQPSMTFGSDSERVNYEEMGEDAFRMFS
tara:strand:- start:3110 stop:5638 length:2529 start_codon:yes stop_codon:yes gene_type:complete